jgi:hypothetical protein
MPKTLLENEVFENAKIKKKHQYSFFCSCMFCNMLCMCKSYL